MARKYASLEDRILANSVVSTEHGYEGTPCWEWTGTTRPNRNGEHYGYFNVRCPKTGKVKHKLVHREVVRHIKGKRLTKRSVVLHFCNNTLCCNPLHVDGGSQKANVRQCVKEGRHKGFQKRDAGEAIAA